MTATPALPCPAAGAAGAPRWGRSLRAGPAPSSALPGFAVRGRVLAILLRRLAAGVCPGGMGLCREAVTCGGPVCVCVRGGCHPCFFKEKRWVKGYQVQGDHVQDGSRQRGVFGSGPQPPRYGQGVQGGRGGLFFGVWRIFEFPVSVGAPFKSPFTLHCK